MAFHDVIISDKISYGSRGGPRFNTEIITTDSGFEERISRWENVRHNFNIGYGITTNEQLTELKQFFIARQGAANTFRFKDWIDHNTKNGLAISMGGQATAFNDQVIEAGDGTKTAFQMIKRYTSGSITRLRNITKPVQGTIGVGVNDVEFTEGVDYTIDYTTGIITFNAAPPMGQDVTWGGDFDNHVRFGDDADKLFDISIDAFRGGSIPTISVVEVIDVEVLQAEYFYGGSEEIVLSGALQLTAQSARFQLLDPGAGNYNIFLPNNTIHSPAGGPFLYIEHSGAAGTLVIKSPYNGVTIETLNPGDIRQYILHIDYDANTQQWFSLG